MIEIAPHEFYYNGQAGNTGGHSISGLASGTFYRVFLNAHNGAAIAVSGDPGEYLTDPETWIPIGEITTPNATPPPTSREPMRAFLSYSHQFREVAARVRSVLADLGITSFMAHEDIEVSEEWRHALLAELERADLFVALLSQDYFLSAWCAGEAGIAASRADLPVIPLSIDGTVPLGFLAHIQSRKFDPDQPTPADLLPGIARRDVGLAIDLITGVIAKSKSYRGAERNFRLIAPYLDRATDAQVVRLLEVSDANEEVCNAAECVVEHIPKLLASHGRLLRPDIRASLEGTLARYH